MNNMRTLILIWGMVIIVGVFTLWFGNKVINENIKQSIDNTPCEDLTWLRDYPIARCK